MVRDHSSSPVRAWWACSVPVPVPWKTRSPAVASTPPLNGTVRFTCQRACLAVGSPGHEAPTVGWHDFVGPASHRVQLRTGLETAAAERRGQLGYRHVDESGAGVIRHRFPVAGAVGARKDRGGDAGLLGIEVAGLGHDHGSARLEVDVACPVHPGDGIGRDGLAGVRIEDVEEAALAGLEDHAAGLSVDLEVGDDLRHRRVMVPRVFGDGLVVPAVGAGVRVHGDHGVGEEDVAGATLVEVEGQRARCTEDHEISDRVVPAGVPIPHGEPDVPAGQNVHDPSLVRSGGPRMPRKSSERFAP